MLTRREREFYKQLGIKVAQFRRERGMSGVEVAQILKIDDATLSYWETGSHKIPLHRLVQLARVLKVEDLMVFVPKNYSGIPGV